jgi:NADPH:quinone reductase-like Zn-dependent oxidoreductase
VKGGLTGRLAFRLRTPKLRVRGEDLAGVAEAVDDDVSEFAGDDVFGTCAGSFAEYAVARSDRLAAKPANLSFERAATVATTGLHRAAGSSGWRKDSARAARAERADHRRRRRCGSFAVQIAKVFGTHVSGVCSMNHCARLLFLRSSIRGFARSSPSRTETISSHWKV